jgi:RNA polymerase sigma-70 factor (ECF subfamily)
MELQMVKDYEFLTQVKSGDTTSFNKIVEFFQTPIHNYLYHLTGDYEVTQDLVQDTFLQAYKSIGKTRDNLPLKTWLYRIATNNAWQYHRRKKLGSTAFLKNQEEVFTKQLGTTHPDENAEIQETLQKLPPKQRVCIILHFLEGFKYSEIAQTFGISEKAVQKRVERGCEQFRKLYKSIT